MKKPPRPIITTLPALKTGKTTELFIPSRAIIRKNEEKKLGNPTIKPVITSSLFNLISLFLKTAKLIKNALEKTQSRKIFL
jgi:hypothetical protein